MSVGRRLLKLARTELGDVFRRFRPGREPSHRYDVPPFDDGLNSRAAAGEAAVPDHVARWYGNLELAVGASAEEVKAAYRRLVRRYHPDRHAKDPGRAALATKLSQELREAYEGLMTYLGEG